MIAVQIQQRLLLDCGEMVFVGEQLLAAVIVARPKYMRSTHTKNKLYVMYWKTDALPLEFSQPNS